MLLLSHRLLIHATNETAAVNVKRPNEGPTTMYEVMPPPSRRPEAMAEVRVLAVVMT